MTPDTARSNDPDTAPATEEPSGSFVDRGWWLAVEYGVVAKQDRFEKKLSRFRSLGVMKELLEPGGRIVYRNLFRQEHVRDAWTLLAELVPWKAQIHCYVKGEEVTFKEAQDLVWCAGYLRDERPCLGEPGKEALAGRSRAGSRAWTIGCNRRVSLAPSGFEEEETVEGEGEDAVRKRHIFSFARVDERGTLVFDRAAIEAFVAVDPFVRRCPLAPARDPARFAGIFRDVSVRALGWPVVLEMGPELQKKLGASVLESEHGFVLKKGQPELGAHEPIELRAVGSADAPGERPVEVRRVQELRPGSIARYVRLPAKVQKVLETGARLRGVRIEEGYVKVQELGGRYEVEQRFVLSTRFHLGLSEDPVKYEGYRVVTVPRPTPEYERWARTVLEEVT